MQFSANFDDEAHADYAIFGYATSDDEYMGIGACYVFSESDSDFDDANRVDDCDVGGAYSEVIEEPSPTGNPVETDRTRSSCLRTGDGGHNSKCCRVSFQPSCAWKDNGVSAFRSWYSQKGIEWFDPAADCMQRKLVNRRASEGLKTEHAVRRLDLPLTITKPKTINIYSFEDEQYRRRTMMSAVTAILRADSLSGDVLGTDEPKHVAMLEKQGQVLLFKSGGGSDGCRWMSGDCKKWETLTLKRMLSSLRRPIPIRHSLAPGRQDRKEYTESIATVMQLDRKVNHIPEIVLRWLVDPGASQHILPQKHVSRNRGMFEKHIKPFTHGFAFETANGLVTPEGHVTAWVQQLREKAEFVVMKTVRHCFR